MSRALCGDVNPFPSREGLALLKRNFPLYLRTAVVVFEQNMRYARVRHEILLRKDADGLRDPAALPDSMTGPKIWSRNDRVQREGRTQ